MVVCSHAISVLSEPPILAIREHWVRRHGMIPLEYHLTGPKTWETQVSQSGELCRLPWRNMKHSAPYRAGRPRSPTALRNKRTVPSMRMISLLYSVNSEGASLLDARWDGPAAEPKPCFKNVLTILYVHRQAGMLPYCTIAYLQASQANVRPRACAAGHAKGTPDAQPSRIGSDSVVRSIESHNSRRIRIN
jgi:hypothetical protein